MSDYEWWKYRPPIHPEAPSDFDLCGGCGISRDMHPQNATCPGGDWRTIGYVGDYGDPRPPEFNDAQFRDPNERTTAAGEYIWWIPQDDQLPPPDGEAGGGVGAPLAPPPTKGGPGGEVTPTRAQQDLEILTAALI